MARVPVPCSKRPPLEVRKPPQLSMEKSQTDIAIRKGSNKLRDPKPILKLAQHELKSGGTLGYCIQHLREASSLQMAGQPLPPLVLEKLLYQALVRCIEEKDFGMGIEVSKLFCGCLGGGSGNLYPSLDFPPPVPEVAVDTSRLVTGAIINTSRCCLELGETQYLQCIGDLCKKCDNWLGTVEEEAAAGYRERMFHIAWRVGVASVADLSIAFVCWREALRLLASEKTFTKMLMLKVHRKGLELEKKGKDESERSQYNTTALKIYRFCHTHVTCQYDVHKSQPSTLSVFSSAYVDWLQHFSSLSEYVGNLKEAKAFLKTAHGYIAAFVSINPRRSNPDKKEKLALHAYVGMLKLQMASMTTAQCSTSHVTGTTSEMEALEQDRRNPHSSLLRTPTRSNPPGDSLLGFPNPTPRRHRVGDEVLQYHKSSQFQGSDYLKMTTPCQESLLSIATPFTATKHLKKDLDLSDTQKIEEKIIHMISRACDYVEGCTEMLEQLMKVSCEGGGQREQHQQCDERTAASIAAILKAWRWMLKGCSTVLFWTDAGVKNASIWHNLQQKAFSILGSLSRTLHNLPPPYCSPVIGALPSGRMLFVAIDSYIRSAAVIALRLDYGGESATAPAKLFLSAEHCLRDAEELFQQGNNSCSFGMLDDLLPLFRRIGAGWFGLGRGLLSCSKSNVDEIAGSLWRGCNLLECWAFSEGNGSDDPFSALVSIQMDVRLSMLSKFLVIKGDMVDAALAAIRAFILCLNANSDTVDSILDPSWGKVGVLEEAVTLIVECLTVPTNENKEECIIGPHSGRLYGLVDYLRNYAFECHPPLLKMAVEREKIDNSTDYICLYLILIQGLEKRHSYCCDGGWNLLALLLRVCRSCSTALANAKSSSAVMASVVMHRECEAKLLEYADRSDECPTELHILALLHSAGFERQLHSAISVLGIDDNNSALPDFENATVRVKRALELSLSVNDGFLKGICEMLSGLLLQDMTEDNEKQTHAIFCAALDTLTLSSLDSCKSGVIVKQLYEYHRSIVEDYFLVECDVARSARAACLRGGAPIAQVIEGLSGAGISYYRAGLPVMAELYLKEASCLLEGFPLSDTAYVRCDGNDTQGVELGKQPRSAATTVGLPSIDKRSRCEHASITPAEPELLVGDTGRLPESDVYSGNSVQITSARIMFRALEALVLVEQGRGDELSLLSASDSLTMIIAGAVKLNDSNPASEPACYAHAVCLMVLALILERQGNLSATAATLRDLLQICIRQAAKAGCKGCDNSSIRMLSFGSSAANNHEDNGEEMTAWQNGILMLQSRWLPLYLEGTSWLGHVWKTQSFSRKAGKYVHMSTSAAKQLKGGGGLVRKCLLAEAALMISKRLLDSAEGLLGECDRLIDEQYGLQYDVGCLSLRHWKKEETRLPVRSHPCCGCLWICAVQSAEVLSLRGDVHRHRGHLEKAAKCYADGNILIEGLVSSARNDPRAFACSIEGCSTISSMASCSVSSSLYGETGSVGPAVQLPQLLYGLLWRRARSAELLGDWISAQPLYETVVQDTVAPPPDKAIVLYRLARHALDKGDDPSRSYELLQQAIAISQQYASPRILRKLRRVVVVAEIQASVDPQGPNELRQSLSWDAASGHLLSIGIAHCKHMLHNAKSRLPFSKSELRGTSESNNLQSASEQLFSFASGNVDEMGGTEALRKAVQQFSLPKGSTDEWIVVGLSLAPTNHLLFTRLRLHSTKLHDPVTVAVPMGQAELSILSDWKAMMEDNATSLKNNDVRGEVTDQKKSWWRQRDALNSAVEEIMSRVENEWFEKAGLDTLLLCKDMNEVVVPSLSVQGNIGSHHAACPSPVHSSSDRKALSRLTVAQLKEELATRGVSTTGCRRKADFIELLLATTTAQEHPLENEQGGEKCSAATIRHRPIILLLDENLLGLSWEAMPCLRGNTVSRVPALPFIFSLRARQKKQNCRMTTNPLPHLGTGLFVVDPEHNLHHTRKTLGSALRVMTENQPGWEGYVGEKPPPGKIIHSLKEREWFIYCGHGSGGLLVDRDEVASLTSCSAAILMGCSSGRLKGQGDFEPSGMVTGYLFGGCQAVVANLWDVTDRDIDRYSLDLLDKLFSKDNHTMGLCKAVSVARAACKMRFIVGHAPVCYGLPI